jgi:hypothetical protein
MEEDDLSDKNEGRKEQQQQKQQIVLAVDVVVVRNCIHIIY